MVLILYGKGLFGEIIRFVTNQMPLTDQITEITPYALTFFSLLPSNVSTMNLIIFIEIRIQLRFCRGFEYRLSRNFDRNSYLATKKKRLKL